MKEENIRKVLERYYIPYITEGKNVSNSFLGINCPYCNDPSEHLGIHKETGIFSCWRCGRKGPLYELLRTLVNISKEEYEALVEKGITFSKSPLEQIQEIIASKPVKENITNDKAITLPECCYPITENIEIYLLTNYLNKRKIELDTCIKYRCYICKAGKYMHRMIVPIFYKRTLVSYQGADLTGRSLIKYKTAPGEVNNYLYNYDAIKDVMIITEGILDAWRVGSSGVATFGTTISARQRNLIIKKNPKQLVFAWDSDAYWKSRKEAKFFGAFIENIHVVNLPKEHDPDSYGREYGKEALNKLLYD